VKCCHSCFAVCVHSYLIKIQGIDRNGQSLKETLGHNGRIKLKATFSKKVKDRMLECGLDLPDPVWTPPPTMRIKKKRLYFMKFVIILKPRWREERGASYYTFNWCCLFVIDVKEVNLQY
jgi:hypothetical protein